MKKLKTLLRLSADLVINFFKPVGLKDEILEIPKHVKKMGMKVSFISFSMTAISLIFAFMLKITNMMIEYRLILLGIILFMLYKGQSVLKEAVHLYETTEGEKFDLIFDDEILLRGGEIVGKTSDKILKYDEKNKFYALMPKESVMNSIKSYLTEMWHYKIHHVFQILEIVSVIIMLITAVITNTSISQAIFIPVLFGFSIISFFCMVYRVEKRKSFYKKHRDYNNEQSQLKNDLLRVPNVVNRDLDMRMGRLKESVSESNKNIMGFHKKSNFASMIVTLVETLGQYAIVIFYLFNIEWNQIDLSTLTEITATLAIVETALGNISRMARILDRQNERTVIIEKEIPDMMLILDVYNEEIKEMSETKAIDEIKIQPFEVSYLEESENDKPFTLVSKETICIEKGEVATLTGVSGSGKSTFMKMLTERIMINKNIDIPSTRRYAYYDEKLKFGSLTIFEEIFCGEENPDLSKMQKILENLHLWSEIKFNCFDVWKWMKEKRFGNTLSNGQNQRLILAKILYWLDDEIDVVVLDECTSGLDDKSETDSADAERILEYIVRFCNKDKKRIVIIATHQNIEGFKENLSSEFVFKDYNFAKNGDYNFISKV